MEPLPSHMQEERASVRFKFKCNLFKTVFQGALLSDFTAFAGTESAGNVPGGFLPQAARSWTTKHLDQKGARKAWDSASSSGPKTDGA